MIWPKVQILMIKRQKKKKKLSLLSSTLPNSMKDYVHHDQYGSTLLIDGRSHNVF